MSNLHYQCRLRQGNTETVTWIPAKAADVGACMNLFEDGEIWRVHIVYPYPQKYKTLKEKQKMDRNSLPSIGTTRVN